MVLQIPPEFKASGQAAGCWRERSIKKIGATSRFYSQDTIFQSVAGQKKKI